MKTKTKQKTQKSEARKQNKKIREKPLLLLHSYSNINQPPPTHPIPHTWALSSPISGPIQLLITLSQRMSTNVLIECLVLLNVFDLCTSQIWFSYWLLVSIAILIDDDLQARQSGWSTSAKQQASSLTGQSQLPRPFFKKKYVPRWEVTM